MCCVAPVFCISFSDIWKKKENLTGNTGKTQYAVDFYVMLITRCKSCVQKDLAKHLGCSQTTYSDYETGKIHVPLETLIEVSRFYQTSVDYLLDLTDERKPYPRHEKRQVKICP